MPDRLEEYIFQGYNYLLERQQTRIKIRFSFCDPVDSELLSEALNTALEKMPYFRMQLCYDTDGPYLAENDSPCVVYRGRRERCIPEETNGYLFYISSEGNTVYSEWLHFITDGRGAFAFLTELAGEYCALRYNEPFDSAEFPDEPGLTWEEIAPYHKPCTQQSLSSDGNMSDLLSGDAHELVMHLDKESVISIAGKYGIKPFSLIIAVFGEVLKNCIQTDGISVGYPVDIRRDISHQNALYNCIAMCRHEIDGFRKFSFEELAAETDRRVRSSLSHEKLMEAAAMDYGMFRDIAAIKVKEKVKQRMYEMTKRICFIHLSFSYVGHFPAFASEQICGHLTDVQTSSDTDFCPCFIVGTSLKDQMILNVQYRYKHEDMPGLIRSVAEELGIKINSMECIKNG